MKNNKKRVLLGIFMLLGIVCTAALVADLAGWIDLSLADVSGVTMAFAAAGVTADAAETVQGTVTVQKETGSTETQDIDIADVSKTITLIGRSKYPVDSILREIGTVNSGSFEYKYYSARQRGARDKVAEAYTATSGSAAGIKKIKVNNAHIWSVDSLVMAPTLTVNDDGSVTASPDGSRNPVVMAVVGIDKATKELTLQPVNTENIPDMPVDTMLARLGTAKDETAARSLDPANMPFDESNYCQIHMTTISMGYYQELQKKDVDWSLVDIKEQALTDFRMTNEATALFGAKRAFTDDITGKLKYASDGIIRKIVKELDMGGKSAIDNDLLYGWTGDIFNGNNGSERRIMFYGNDFGRSLAHAATFQKQLEAGKTEIVMGIKFQKIETTDGILLTRKHPLLSEYGYGKAAIVIDPAFVCRAVHKAMEITPLALDKAGISRSNDVRIDECHCPVVTNPETHAIIWAK